MYKHEDKTVHVLFNVGLSLLVETLKFLLKVSYLTLSKFKSNVICKWNVSNDRISLVTLFQTSPRVPRGSVVRCLTRNPGVLGSSLTRSSGFFSWECPWAKHFRA